MTTTLRATVMLVILVGAPTAWIYLGPLPVGAQQVVTRLISEAKSRLGLVSFTAPGQQKISAPRFDFSESADNKTLIHGSTSARILSNVELELEQLRGMGVAEYALEPWGTGRNLYRFHCIMPIGSSDNLTIQFEAVNEDPTVSVRQVLHEVAIWQQDRLNSPRTRLSQRIPPLQGATRSRGL